MNCFYIREPREITQLTGLFEVLQSEVFLPLHSAFITASDINTMQKMKVVCKVALSFKVKSINALIWLKGGKDNNPSQLKLEV